MLELDKIYNLDCIICNGWNVCFCIEDGSLLEIKTRGKENSIFEYMQANVEKCLSSKCFVLPKISNRENAMLQWEQIHDD